MKPIILTAGDDKFRDIIDISVAQIERFGYTPLVYDLGGLGIGERYDKETKACLKNPNLPWDELLPTGKRSGKQFLLNRRAPAPWKPQFYTDVIDSLTKWEQLVWLDGDAVITKPIDEIFRDDYDIAVTLRGQKGKQFQSRYLNTGVLVFRNTHRARGFLARWADAQNARPKDCDQHILHILLEKENTGIDIKSTWNRINFLGARVLLLPPTYNHTIGNPSRIDLARERQAKIWHLKASYYPHKKDLKDLFLREVKKRCEEGSK